MTHVTFKYSQAWLWLCYQNINDYSVISEDLVIGALFIMLKFKYMICKNMLSDGTVSEEDDDEY